MHEDQGRVDGTHDGVTNEAATAAVLEMLRRPSATEIMEISEDISAEAEISTQVTGCPPPEPVAKCEMRQLETLRMRGEQKLEFYVKECAELEATCAEWEATVAKLESENSKLREAKPPSDAVSLHEWLAALFAPENGHATEAQTKVYSALQEVCAS